jgi:septal ring factor EnvC (AmiA/AmiB activator)
MPFDPTIPQPNTPADADAMRAQFNALNDKIDAQAATIATLQAQVASLQTDLANLQTQVNNRATTTDLNNAIAGTANSTNGVSDLSGMPISDPPTQGEVIAIFDKLNETINASHR